MERLASEKCVKANFKITKLKARIKRVLKKVKVWYLLTFKYKFKTVGSDFYCGSGLHVFGNNIEVGNRVFFGHSCHFGIHDTKIGNNVMFAPEVALIGGDHNFNEVGIKIIDTGMKQDNFPDKKRLYQQGSLVIADDVWVGYGATIMAGVTIGEGAVVGARALVTSDVEPYSIYIGQPAKKYKDRFASEEEKVKHSLAIGGTYHEQKI